MNENPAPSGIFSVLRRNIYLCGLVLPIGILAGTASAGFLWSLERVTEIRWQNPWLLWLLPAAGAAIVWSYERYGKTSGAGNNLILDRIHDSGGGVPRRMAPFVLVATLVTHLFGGSAGREGTAVQMGGSLASGYARLFKIEQKHLRILLIAGVAAGFGSVFGTPLAGAIFAVEVLVIGRLQIDGIFPALIASWVGSAVCSAWGVHHTVYHISLGSDQTGLGAVEAVTFGKIALAAIVFGLVSRAFVEATHAIQHLLEKFVVLPPLRAVLGGLSVIALVYALGTRDFLGIGVHSPDPHAVTLLSAFLPDGANDWSWCWKLIFTAVTLGSGFKGGEVTPLFFIGATLGHALAVHLGAPVDLLAGLGFLAVFAAAANTPLACTVMGCELFGSHYAVYFAVACFIAFFASGNAGIYGSQRVTVSKWSMRRPDTPHSLREIRESRRRGGGRRKS